MNNKLCDIKDFIFNAFDSLNKDDLDFVLGFLGVTWDNRNKTLFGKNYLSASNTVVWLRSYLEDYKNAQIKSPDVTQPSSMGDHDPAVVDRGSFKLCTDTTIDYKISKLGLGVVVKDDHNNIIAGLAIPISGLFDSTHAEALALNFALRWCSAVNLPVLKVVSNSKNLVNKITTVIMIYLFFLI
uniref:RNase H type-1 domain-containing protein n=1 Tax=Cannabis sativa TaxID=3483 RepID=A0A803PK35_CANSA